MPETTTLPALADGTLVVNEEILQGIERYPDALQFMFQGGKLLVQVGNQPINR